MRKLCFNKPNISPLGLITFIFPRIFIFPLYLTTGFVTTVLADEPLSEPTPILTVIAGKMEVLQLNQPARILSVGDNSVVEIFLDTAAKIVLTGLKPGETSLLAIDFHGDVIVELDVVVVPQNARHVTVHRSVSRVDTLSCYPRCVGIVTQGEDEDEETASAGPPEDVSEEETVTEGEERPLPSGE